MANFAANLLPYWCRIIYYRTTMNLLRTTIGLLSAFILLFTSCNTDNESGLSSAVSFNAKVVQMEFYDAGNRKLTKDELADFRVVDQRGSAVSSFLEEHAGVVYYGFYPTFPANPKGAKVVNLNFVVYKGATKVAVVESTFKLEDVRQEETRKVYYYTNTVNKIDNRAVTAPTKVVVGKGSAS